MEDERIFSLPLFISYPRAGAHWINCVMELYFDRPRLREGRITFLDRARNDWMWFHDHDPELKIKHDNVLYLYREPISTIYSNLIYHYYDDRKLALPFRFIRWNNVFSEKNVTRFAEDYRNYMLKWLFPAGRARIVISHDRMQLDRNEEFKKTCDFFNLELDEKRLAWAFGQVTKEELVERVRNKTHMGKHILHKSYQNQRNDFRKVWGSIIRNIVIVSELRPFLEPNPDIYTK